MVVEPSKLTLSWSNLNDHLNTKSKRLFLIVSVCSHSILRDSADQMEISERSIFRAFDFAYLNLHPP